jgi:hypothetical protein
VNKEEIEKAKADLTEATKRYKRARDSMKKAGEDAMTLALDLIRAEVPPSVVERLSPFTDSYIRKAAREAGLPPVRPARSITTRELMTGKPEGPAARRIRGQDPPA